jgi:hypothetical protein
MFLRRMIWDAGLRRSGLELQRLLAEKEKHLAKVVQLVNKGKAPQASRAAVEACLEKALEDLRNR